MKKSFGKTHAVAGVDLAVSAGGVYGVLGPNGAGKTTTIRMLATLLRPMPERRKCSVTTSCVTPGWMQAVVEVNPISHLATVVRGLMDGSVPAGEIGWVLVSSVLLVAVFGPITMVLYRNKK